MQRPDRLGIGAVVGLPAIPPHVDEPDVTQDPQVLGHRRLGEPEGDDDVADRALLRREIAEDVPAARLRDGVEDVRGGGRAG